MTQGTCLTIVILLTRSSAGNEKAERKKPKAIHFGVHGGVSDGQAFHVRHLYCMPRTVLQ